MVDAVANNTAVKSNITNQVVNPKNVPYKRTNEEILSLRSSLMEAINAGFNGWKDLFSSSNPDTLAYLDLSTTSRVSSQAPGHYIRSCQQGMNEEDPDASWMTVPDRHLWCAQSKMDCYC